MINEMLFNLVLIAILAVLVSIILWVGKQEPLAIMIIVFVAFGLAPSFLQMLADLLRSC